MEETLDNVINICQVGKIFTMAEANDLVPLLTKIVGKCESEISKELAKQRFMIISGAKQEIVNSIDVKIGRLLTESGVKVTKLGCKVIGNGFIGIDSGFGYWSWVLGEEKITHYHDYTQSPFERRQLGIIYTPGVVNGA